MPGYTGLLGRLLEEVHSEDRKEGVDLVHHCGGLGAKLGSGFRWVGSEAKPHQWENPLIGWSC